MFVSFQYEYILFIIIYFEKKIQGIAKKWDDGIISLKLGLKTCNTNTGNVHPVVPRHTHILSLSNTKEHINKLYFKHYQIVFR
jgi:hypothetical protein